MKFVTGCLAVMVLAAFAGPAAAARRQDALDPVRELYAVAQYEKALSLLQRLKSDPGFLKPVDIDRYRVLCLLALGRNKEADVTIEAVLTNDPLFRLRADEASPAVRAAYTTVRQRILPALARAAYSEGREAFDRRDLAGAVGKFERALELANDPDGRGHAALSEWRVLSEGFLELARATLGQPAARYAAEAGLDPVVIRQEMPQWTFALASAFYEPNLRAVVEIEIDAQGDVLSADVVQSSHPQYNATLAKAALAWKYEPGRRNGQPARSRQRVDVVLKPK